MKVVVIGAGASGLSAAIILKRRGIDVTLIEKNKQVGKKILVTGAGKCNYFNEDFRSCYFTSSDKMRLENIITKEHVEATKDFLRSIGIVPKIKNGYYYPSSLKAISIQNSLMTEVKNLQIPILYDTTVKRITKDKHFSIYTNQEVIEAEVVVVATGSRAYYDTEEPSMILKSLEDLGHTVMPIYPGLVQLEAKGDYFKEWAGIRLDARLSFYSKDIQKEVVGELQLTDYGISGICTLILSNTLVPLLKEKNEKITINFLDPLHIYSVEEAREYLVQRNKDLPNRSLDELLDTILDYKLTNLLLKLAKIPLHTKMTMIEKEKLDVFLKNLVSFPLTITGFKSYKNAQICLGGIAIKEINTNTMESKMVENLYIVGEALDVSGECGGYNLGFAWLSGLIAGRGVFLD